MQIGDVKNIEFFNSPFSVFSSIPVRPLFCIARIVGPGFVSGASGRGLRLGFGRGNCRGLLLVLFAGAGAKQGQQYPHHQQDRCDMLHKLFPFFSVIGKIADVFLFFRPLLFLLYNKFTQKAIRPIKFPIVRLKKSLSPAAPCFFPAFHKFWGTLSGRNRL